ncbi:hypothetical protein AKJ40_01235 [candidate division MSBL1 archaeon SCGC-AAA259M10]|uniref:Histidine kinase domain-containing protein n=1 Tax=candidate division MSBL1 archaeon SCGC-AAA259M10 TaxID=1698270 RepID=A0A133V244_9EURY|nr:hypothetical protein AKJ40_01235 [candidate division MSBL1 archaeon SCGC-AAA259M10]
MPIRLLKRQQERQIEGTKSGTEKHLADYWKKQEKKAEVRKEFLNTLLRQDLRSKFQTIQGYLQLLDEVDLPDEHREYLRKAVKAGGEADEILELGRKLEEIEETEWVAEKHIVKVLVHVIEDISDLVERQGVEIEEDYPEGIGRVKGDYSLSTLFSQILKTRIRTAQCDKIKISTERKDGKLLVKVEDNGKRLPVDIKNLFKGEPYTGETTGAGGVRYYMLREIAKHNNAEIEVQDSELGGGKFNIYLQKV